MLHKFSNNVLNQHLLLSQLHLYHCIIFGYVCQRYCPSMNESSVFKIWYDSFGDVENAEVSVLDDVIAVCAGTNNVTYILMKIF